MENKTSPPKFPKGRIIREGVMPEKYLGKSKYRIAQVADNRFIIEERIVTVSPWWVGREVVEEWKEVFKLVGIRGGGSTITPITETIEFESLESARKWIADKQKYPIYHPVDPDQPGRDYENLETK